MALTGADKKDLSTALLSAFPTVEHLAQMVAFKCDRRLDEFSQGPLRDRVFRLVEEAEAQGWIAKLVSGAHEENPGNEPLREIQRRFSTSTALPPSMAPSLPHHGVVGRDEVLTELCAALELDDDAATNVPPVALRGMGGIGKTTLAIALSRLDVVARRFPDGVLWAALGPRPTIRVFLDSWGKALGVDLLAEPDEAACQERLRAALYRRRALLVIDDVWSTEHGRYFDVAGPHCRLLLTTRDLPVAQELATRPRTFRLDVLKPEPALLLLQRLAPETAADVQSARRLCERLEFLPLALTLAARLLANQADVPPLMQRLTAELVERRSARLALAQTEARPGLDGDQPVTLQAILGLSVERLSRDDQERFAMLSVFGGEPLTWEIAAAANVWECSMDEAEATTARFIQRGLVERRDGRYWIHALLADFAAEMLEEMGL